MVRFSPFFDPLMGASLTRGRDLSPVRDDKDFNFGMVFVQNAPMRSSYRPRRTEGAGPILLIAGVVILALAILGTIGLGVYGGNVAARQQPVEQELPDARFPR